VYYISIQHPILKFVKIYEVLIISASLERFPNKILKFLISEKTQTAKYSQNNVHKHLLHLDCLAPCLALPCLESKLGCELLDIDRQRRRNGTESYVPFLRLGDARDSQDENASNFTVL